MSILSGLFGRGAGAAAPRLEPVLSAAGPVAVSTAGGPAGRMGTVSDAGWIPLDGGRSRVKNLPAASPASAERQATVFACCNIIAGDLSKVRVHVMRRDADGIERRAAGHPVETVLNVEASEGLAGPVVRYAQAYALALQGEAFAWARRSGRGEVEALELVQSVTPLRNGRRRFYEFTDADDARRRVMHRDMVHLRFGSLDGWRGRSPIRVAADSVSLALGGHDMAARGVAGVALKAYVAMPDFFRDEETAERTSRAVRRALNDEDARGIPMLEGGAMIRSLDLSPADAQLLELMKFNREQVAAIYRMPPAKLQMLEHGVKANSEQQAIDYRVDCLQTWATLIEGQYALTLLTEAERRAGFFLRHNLDALLRATTKERYDALVKATGGPIMTPNEARRADGLPPVPEGDRLYPPANMTREEDGDSPSGSQGQSSQT
ncbi:phage portal protein [Paroceanicella profunda]|uniref:Phage portal protein n=1 Tax=Paroceanicella profunda TaxID=2579971 RepID=A0A5B8FGX3_9RHOB|nr:phage portal protein [Paroceanicella profunda]QDL91507.1 phage portal protein [Paroceanicella profunda]